MIPLALTSTIATVEDYFWLEDQSEIRHEYRDGQVIPMTGGTPNHNELAGALFVALRLALRGKPYRVFIADQRLSIPKREIYIYPDIVVLLHPIRLQEGRKDTVINPILIAEILSPSTQSYDRGDKFEAYRSVATFQEYLLINQDYSHVEHYARQKSSQWLLTDHIDPPGELTLASLQININLQELYENVAFPHSDGGSPAR
ncbi:MAG: Uma2 family endonuclease [Synechococcaceae cyanobacterium SM2_3_1]|nr:Uma2 family endonuclease [Synechococcaceae cyanobacterium SM2_3_1]